MDTGADNHVLLDYNWFGGGNGNSDCSPYIPATFFANVPGSQFFYLYTSFGEQMDSAGAHGTFEEWAFQSHAGHAWSWSWSCPALALAPLVPAVAASPNRAACSCWDLDWCSLHVDCDTGNLGGFSLIDNRRRRHSSPPFFFAS